MDPEEIARARRQRDSIRFAVLPTGECNGGVRPRFTDNPTCGEDCHGQISEFWLDYTNFLPDPLCEEEIPEFCPGYCELRSALVEALFCLPNKFPGPRCPKYSRTLGDWVIAVKYVPNKVGCQKQFFKPFHRTGNEPDIFIATTDKFGDPMDGATKSYRIATQFVSNFQFADMTISGASWLQLQDGWLVGQPPPTQSRTRYEFSVTSRNAAGQDSVDLAVIVTP